jgi:hypothetical protein
MADAEARSKGKATVAIKVIRKDGTEETYVSDDVTVANVEVVAKLMKKLRGGDQ